MKSLFLYNFDENDDRLISEIQQAKEDAEGRISICSTLGFELNDQVFAALSDLLENMDPTNESGLVTLALGGCKYSNRLDRIIYLAHKLMVLEKICLDDARFVPILERGIVLQQNSNLKEISLSIASSAWKKATLGSLCCALKSSAPNLECLRVRTWTYGGSGNTSGHGNFYRNESQGLVNNTSSWDEGLDTFLDAMIGKKSLLYLQLQVFEMFSLEQKSYLQNLLSHSNCRLAHLDLRVQKTSDTSSNNYSTIEWLVPAIKANTFLKSIHLSGWSISTIDKDYLLAALQSCRHLESFKFDRSRLTCDPNQFVKGLLELDFLKTISSYSNSLKSGCNLDIESLIPAIIQNNSVENLKVTDINVSITVMNKLLKVIGSCPTLKSLKIVNIPRSTTTTTTTMAGGGGENHFLDPLTCCHLQRLQLVGFAPFVSKRKLFAFYKERQAWFYNALEQNPRLYRFGPGEESYGLNRFLASVDGPLLYLADLNRFGRIFFGKPEYRFIWPIVLARVNDQLQDPERQASVIYGLLSNGLLSSC